MPRVRVAFVQETTENTVKQQPGTSLSEMQKMRLVWVHRVRRMKALTKLYAANSRTKSLKTTVPEDLVVFLNLKAGETVEWVGFTEDGKKMVEVKKVE